MPINWPAAVAPGKKQKIEIVHVSLQMFISSTSQSQTILRHGGALVLQMQITTRPMSRSPGAHHLSG